MRLDSRCANSSPGPRAESLGKYRFQYAEVRIPPPQPGSSVSHRGRIGKVKAIKPPGPHAHSVHLAFDQPLADISEPWREFRDLHLSLDFAAAERMPRPPSPVPTAAARGAWELINHPHSDIGLVPGMATEMNLA